MKKFFSGFVLCTISFSTTFASFDTTHNFNFSLQKYPLSCEFSAIKSIINRHTGIQVTEDELIEKIPKSWFEKPAIFKNGQRVWGDPEQGFVGGVKFGNQYKYTGYGVHEKPIQALLREFQLPSQIKNIHNYKTNNVRSISHLTQLLGELHRGKSIFVRADYCTDPMYEDGQKNGKLTNKEMNQGINAKNICTAWGKNRTLSWKTLREGRMVDIKTLSGDHSYIILGYIGTIEEPSHIKVFDTSTGIHTYPVHEWMRKWNARENRSLIVSKNKESWFTFPKKSVKNHQKINKKEEKKPESIKKEVHTEENTEKEKGTQSTAHTKIQEYPLLKTLPMYPKVR